MITETWAQDYPVDVLLSKPETTIAGSAEESQMRVECDKRSMESESARRRLQARLREVEEVFAREMRAKGFDPSQADTVPLTPRLAKLYQEGADLREQLKTLEE